MWTPSALAVGAAAGCCRWSCASSSTTGRHRGTASGWSRRHGSRCPPGDTSSAGASGSATSMPRRIPGRRARDSSTPSAGAFDGVSRRSMRRVASWERAARGVVADLLDPEQSQVSLTVDGDAVLGLRAYARDATRYYEHDADHYGADDRRGRRAATPALPAAASGRGRRTARRPPAGDAPQVPSTGGASTSRTGFPADGVEPVTDTWYFLLNGLIKVPWVAEIAGDRALAAVAIDGLQGAARLADAAGRPPAALRRLSPTVRTATDRAGPERERCRIAGVRCPPRRRPRGHRRRGTRSKAPARPPPGADRTLFP